MGIFQHAAWQEGSSSACSFCPSLHAQKGVGGGEGKQIRMFLSCGLTKPWSLEWHLPVLTRQEKEMQLDEQSEAFALKPLTSRSTQLLCAQKQRSFESNCTCPRLCTCLGKAQQPQSQRATKCHLAAAHNLPVPRMLTLYFDCMQVSSKTSTVWAKQAWRDPLTSLQDECILCLPQSSELPMD